DDAGPDAGDDAGDDAWGESRTAESMPPETGAGAPEPPVLPAGAGRPVGAALAAGGDGKRTLLGVPSGSPVPLYGRSYADDADDGPTEEVDPALALAGHRGALAGLADDEPGAPDDDLDDGPDDARDDDRDDVRDEDLDDDDDEPAPARLEDMSNPLDRRLPRPAELAPAEPGPRPPAGEAAAASGRSGGPGGLASTLRGPAPVPMAPAGRAVGPDRAEDGAQAASALQGAAGAAGAFGAGPAGRVHAAAQAQDPAARRSPAAGQGAPGASPNAFNGASGAGGDDASDDASASISNAFGDPFTGDSGAGFGAGSGAGSGAGFEGPRRLDRAGLAHVAAMDGPIGPTAGLARRSAVQDVAFAKGKIRPLPDDAGNEIAEVRPAGGSSRAGRWIVAVALVLMAASAAVVYTLVFRPAGDAIDGLALDADAGSGEPGAPDGGADSAATEELAELVRTRLAMDTQAGLEALDRQLKDVGGDAMLAARARVHTAQAQHLFDGVALAGSDAARAAELDREAKALVLEALTLAQRALQADREAPDALVAMADVQRLQGRQARQVESYLETALKREPEHREARLVRALMLAASERTRKDARALLESLSRSAQGLDVRPGYRLALLDLAEAKPEDARRRASEVLAVDPAHEGARALLAHLDASPVVDTSDPMPVEETPSPAPEGNGKDTDRDTGDHARDEGSSGGSYDDLVARADKKAQAKDCREAIELYERALDDNPSGVSALMGMAECHVERKEFASAYAKLQAVLAVSPSHAEALWRMAEAYRKQGLSAQAESWYRKYVEEHPSGPRASKARQRIDELGNAAPAPGGGSGSGAGGSGTEPAGGGSTEPPAGQGDPPPASAPGSGDAPGATAG
ncbi:MAG TPA: tetratricopeptide repeat protein, partial [Haliangium sp.]|nr:tetratricopeptide repeat protein [Haliangium sp.]